MTTSMRCLRLAFLGSLVASLFALALFMAAMRSTPSLRLLVAARAPFMAALREGVKPVNATEGITLPPTIIATTLHKGASIQTRTSPPKTATQSGAPTSKPSDGSTTATPKPKPKPFDPQLKQNAEHTRAGDPYWQWMDVRQDVCVFSAHYDDVSQPPVARIVALGRSKLTYVNVTCLLRHCAPPCPVVLSVSGRVSHHRNPNGRKYIGSFVVCPLAEAPDGVTFSLVSVKREDNSTYHTSWETSPLTIYYSVPVNSTSRKDEDGKQDSNPLKGSPAPIIHTTTDRNYNTTGVSSAANNSTPVQQSTAKAETDAREKKMAADSTKNEKNAVPDFTNQTGEGYSHFRWNVTRCFPSLQNYFSNHYLLTEMVAASRALGVDRFAFYVESASPKVYKTLQVLEDRGLAEFWQWNVHFSAAKLYYAGQFSAIQDCLYRHIRSSRYILFGDVDELFVPLASDSLLTVLDTWARRRPQCGTFLFLNTFFHTWKDPPPKPTPATTTNITTNTTTTNNTNNSNSSSKDLPAAAATNLSSSDLETLALARRYNLSMVVQTRRDRLIWNPAARSKPAVDPRKTMVGSVHVVDKMRPGFKSCVMDRDGGLLFHYRGGMRVNEKKQVQENRLLPFTAAIVKESVQIIDIVNKP